MKIGDRINLVLSHSTIQWATSYWPIIFRAFLYFSLESLPPIFKGLREFGRGDVKISAWFLTAFAIEALYHGLLGIRIYFDGSAVRLDPKNGNGNGNGNGNNNDQQPTQPTQAKE